MCYHRNPHKIIENLLKTSNMEKNQKIRHKNFMRKTAWFAEKNFTADVHLENTVPMNARKETIT